jgi:hypothetical protein
VLLEGKLTDFGHWYIELEFRAAGSYSFYIKNKKNKGELNYIVVEPQIIINGEEIPESVSFI